jgi:hypothetical protein
MASKWSPISHFPNTDMCPAHLILIGLTTLTIPGERKNYEDLCNGIYSITCSSLLYPNTCHNTLLSNTLNLCSYIPLNKVFKICPTTYVGQGDLTSQQAKNQVIKTDFVFVIFF